jgi:hypothetical protein
MKRSIAALSIAALAGCAGQVDYIQPKQFVTPDSNTKIINKPRDAVWNSAVQALGKQFFVINNIDKSSGLLNVSYSGDPEKYVDCGLITSKVKNLAGERVHMFLAAKAQQTYEIMNVQYGLMIVDRRMDLDGRINVIFEEASPTSTRVTANTRYVLKRTTEQRNPAGQRIGASSNTISFNTAGRASFPGGEQNGLDCVAIGSLERELLDLIN